jgi:hypothetical protein
MSKAQIKNALLLWFGLAAGSLLPGLAAADPGLPFLRLGSGARSAALAEAVTALPGADAISYNPAALQMRGRSTAFTHGEWIQDIRHEYLSFAFGKGQSAVGVALQVSQAHDLEFRTDPSAEPLGEFGVYEGALNLAYARRWNQNMHIGANLKLIRQAIYTETAAGVGLDLGLLYRVHPHLRLGLAARNLGRMNELDQEATALPRTVRLGLAYTGLPSLLLSLEAQHLAGGSTTLHLGGEYAVHRHLSVRGGYQNADSRNLALGLGTQTGVWSVNYAFIPFKSGLGEAHRLSVVWHHDANYSRKKSPQ